MFTKRSVSDTYKRVDNSQQMEGGDMLIDTGINSSETNVVNTASQG